MGTDSGQYTPVIDQCGSDDDAGCGERVEQESAASRRRGRAGRFGFAGEFGW
jgi:hypothetical protein